jgi:CxxC motif-containing protein (DUF1111 family)
LLPSIGHAQVDQEETPDIDNGKLLFERNWVADAGLESGGLGPLYNASSCVACHNQGGIGGGGDNPNNAQLLSILPAKNRNGSFDLSAKSLERMFEEGEKIHQDLAEVNGMVLHRFGTVETYARWRDKLLWGEAESKTTQRENRMLDTRPIHRITRDVPSQASRSRRRASSNITLQVSQRNTPSLFGSGLIENIPGEALLDIQELQKSKDDGIRGTIARLNRGFGKFGWRGQKSSLSQFTIQACAVELGLRTATQAESSFPNSMESPKDFFPKTELDMTRKEVVDMVGFIRQLPPPMETLPDDPKKFDSVKKGERVFTRLNCATCHVKKMGDVNGVYSDFLMHDMGPGLADVSGVISKSTLTSGPGIGGYFGPSTSLKTDSRTRVSVGTDSFWQTPPLWGIALSAPYMHDGRAENLHEAILHHGGEAENSKQGYERLNVKYRRHLLAYLETLGAIEE